MFCITINLAASEVLHSYVSGISEFWHTIVCNHTLLDRIDMVQWLPVNQVIQVTGYPKPRI